MLMAFKLLSANLLSVQTILVKSDRGFNDKLNVYMKSTKLRELPVATLAIVKIAVINRLSAKIQQRGFQKDVPLSKKSFNHNRE